MMMVVEMEVMRSGDVSGDNESGNTSYRDFAMMIYTFCQYLILYS